MTNSNSQTGLGNKGNSLDKEQIISIEEQVIQLRNALGHFAKTLPKEHSNYGENYNYLGTLKVNLSVLARTMRIVSEQIRINI